MAKTNNVAKEAGNVLSALLSLIAWLTGLLVALAVGFGMTEGILLVPKIPAVITASAGWVVIVLAVLSAVLALFDRFSR